MDARQYKGLMAVLGSIADRMGATVGVPPPGGPADYRPMTRDMAGEMRGLWLDDVGESHWVLTDERYEYVARGRGWRQAYVRGGER